MADAARDLVNAEHEQIILDYLKGKTVQNKFSEIVELQKQDPFYHAIMYDLPHDQLSWLMRACVDCLPSYANLRRWNKVLSDKCVLCDQRETMRHSLNGCTVALNQLRFNLRHDSILLHVVRQTLASKCHDDKRIIADLPGYTLDSGGTIPPELVVTTKFPDLVLIHKETKKVEIFELTSCTDSKERIKESQARKTKRYTKLATDLKAATELEAPLRCFEVCALGNIPAHSRETIRYLVGKKAAKATFKSLAKIAIATSYYLFNRRREKIWIAPPLFERPTVECVSKD